MKTITEAITTMTTIMSEAIIVSMPRLFLRNLRSRKLLAPTGLTRGWGDPSLKLVSLPLENLRGYNERLLGGI